jgi:Cu2+-exporting ATPase
MMTEKNDTVHNHMDDDDGHSQQDVSSQEHVHVHGGSNHNHAGHATNATMKNIGGENDIPEGHGDHGMHATRIATEDHTEHGAAHADHSGHEQMFRRKFWVSLVLSLPVVLYSSGLQMMLGFSLPAFPGSQWLAPFFAVIVFIYGGLPFLQLAVPEFKNRQPGMMTLISLAISVAFIYSAATLFLPGQMDFFWELVTLIDIMLLGHWIEMRSVRQASGALDALAKLMPDTAERILPDGSMETVQTAFWCALGQASRLMAWWLRASLQSMRR